MRLAFPLLLCLLAFAPDVRPADLPSSANRPASGAFGNLLPGRTDGADEFLSPDQAFQVSAEPSGANSATVHFVIADGYYLYRQRMKFTTASTTAQLGAAKLPQGESHHDEYFGEQEIYRLAIDAEVPFARASPAAMTLPLTVTYQGCADAGLCYPPQTRTFELTLPAMAAGAPTGAARQSEQDRLSQVVTHGSLGLVVSLFFGFGLLLAFSPCVLPMIPILSGIIAGQGTQVTPARGFALSLAYVLGMALTYTIAGVAFALAGQQAQAFFQQTWIIVGFALLFVALAVAMFGGFELQMPSAIQTRLSEVSGRLRGGTFVSTAIMGMLSSLIVTACVAPPLVAALAVVGQTGDVVRGGLALFALSLGMGTPLLVVGASAGSLLPKAGPWMETIKAVFGTLFLGVAVWMLSRVLSPRLVQALWGVVALSFVWVALWVGIKAGRRSGLRWITGVAAGVYGLALLASAALGGSDPLRPMAGTPLSGTHAAETELPFRRIKSVADLDREVNAAAAAGKRVMVDFYADWCVSCKEMEKYTFTDPAVRAALAEYVLLQSDVTANDADDQALMKRFAIYGPPTTAFFAPDGQERTAFRLVGFVKAAEFRQHLAAFQQAP